MTGSAEDFLSVTEAAAECGVSERTVWVWIKAGKIRPDPGMRRFRRTLLSKADVHELIESRRAEA